MVDIPEQTFEPGSEGELSLDELNENETRHVNPAKESRFNEEIPDKPKSSKADAYHFPVSFIERFSFFPL